MATTPATRAADQAEQQEQEDHGDQDGRADGHAGLGALGHRRPNALGGPGDQGNPLART